jgi:hypothetical protein
MTKRLAENGGCLLCVLARKLQTVHYRAGWSKLWSTANELDLYTCCAVDICSDDGKVQIERLAIHAGHYSAAKTFHRCHPKSAACLRLSHFWDKGEPCPLGAFMDIPTSFTNAHTTNGSSHRSSHAPLPELLCTLRHVDSLACPCTHASFGPLDQQHLSHVR